MLESLLIVTAVAVAVAAVTVTVTANLVALDRSFGTFGGESLYNRRITVKPKTEDYEAFYLGVTAADVREIGPSDGQVPKLELRQLAEAARAAPTVSAAYIQDWRSFSHQALGDEWLSAPAVTEGFLTAARLEVAEGSLFSATDFEAQNNVMLLSPNAAEKLGLEGEVIGQQVVFGEGEGSYTVVGVLQLTEAQDEDDYYEAFIPWRPSPWGDEIREFTFVVEDASAVRQAQAELRAYADATWGEGIVVRSSAESSSIYLGAQRTRLFIIAVFASLGLVVAALNIMSLMLARVLRRGREIGVRRSLGASRRGIRNQFLGEALTLGLLGGLVGVAFGYGLFRVYGSYMESVYEGSGAFLTFSPVAALAAFGAALLISVLFGLYPAVTASRLRIVDTLKEA